MTGATGDKGPPGPVGPPGSNGPVGEPGPEVRTEKVAVVSVMGWGRLFHSDVDLEIVCAFCLEAVSE